MLSRKYSQSSIMEQLPPVNVCTRALGSALASDAVVAAATSSASSLAREV